MEWFLKWLVGWCKIVDGIADVVTLSFFRPNLTMKAARTLSRYRFNNK